MSFFFHFVFIFIQECFLWFTFISYISKLTIQNQRSVNWLDSIYLKNPWWFVKSVSSLTSSKKVLRTTDINGYNWVVTSQISTSLIYEVDGNFSITLEKTIKLISKWRMKVHENIPDEKCSSHKHNCKVDCNSSFKVESLEMSCSIANAQKKKRRKIRSQHFIHNFSFQFYLHFYTLIILNLIYLF